MTNEKGQRTKDKIDLYVSEKELTLKPGKTDAVFYATVVNLSDRPCQFQVDLTAAGNEETGDFSWYSIEPEVSSKKPPGDTTHFWIKIVQSPLASFSGLINLTLRVFSVDTQAEERQILRLWVEEGDAIAPIQGELKPDAIVTLPNQTLEINARIHNPNNRGFTTQIQLIHLPATWDIDPSLQTLQLLPQQDYALSWHCYLPEEVPAGEYPFAVQITPNRGNSSLLQGRIIVQPTGAIAFEVNPENLRLPQQRPWLIQKRLQTVQSNLILSNQSNQAQNIQIQAILPQNNRKPVSVELSVETPIVELPIHENSAIACDWTAQRPILGWGQTVEIPVEAFSLNSDLEVSPSPQIILLKLLPVIPRWLQGLFAILFLIACGALWSWQNRLQGHQAAITSLDFNGLGTGIVSSSNDGTARIWPIKRRLGASVILADTDKAIRVAQFRPVGNNGVALGLENGEIQLRDLLAKTDVRPTTLVYEKDDRVMDLAFTQDSRSLFSGHGSGRLLQWSIAPTLDETPIRQKQFDYAISDITLLGETEGILAIGGRYNQLTLWDWQQDRIANLDYRTGGQDDYITRLASAEQRPNFLAIADNQGDISLWNTQDCFDTDCEALDTFTASEEGLRSLALSADGCYLASGGDDGQLRLWTLTQAGSRSRTNPDGTVIANLGTPIYSVDLLVKEDRLAIAIGTLSGRIRLYRQDLNPLACR